MVALPTPPTVREMARLALPLGSSLVAGSLGLERPVRWARTSGVLSPLFPTLNADEAALIDLPLVQASNPALVLARMVRELGRLRLAAIVVKGEVDGAARREADRSNLPLFVLPAGSDLPRVARAIIRLITDREIQEEAQAATLYRRLSQGVAAGVGLEGLVEELHRLVGHALRVTTLRGAVLAQAGHAPPTSTELTRPLFVSDAPAAILALRDTPDRLDDFSRLALEQGAAALALELVKMEAVEAAREGAYGDFVVTLLLGEDDALLAARARAADYPLEGVHWVIVGVADAARTAEETMGNWLRRAAAHAETMNWQPRLHVGETRLAPADRAWQGTLVVGGGNPEWEAHRAVFLDELAEMWPTNARLSLGAGDPARGLSGLRQALAQATDALILGLRLFGPGRYLHRDMGLYRLLRHLQGTADLAPFLDQTLAALEAYDQEHDGELVQTLHALLDHGGNVSATARALHLHRNSLVYRLDRIREVSGMDPDDPNDAFAFRLALMLAPLR